MLRNAEGKTRLIHVNERVRTLDQFKKGDEILILHTEALAITQGISERFNDLLDRLAARQCGMALPQCTHKDGLSENVIACVS